MITRLIHVRSSSTAEQAPFNPGKLTISIAEAFQHDRAHGRSVAWDLMQTTSGLLLASTPPLTPVSRLELAELTHTVLQRFDSRAAITYALQHHLDYTIKNKSANKH
ncbi:MAG: hypothetical protein WAQ25_00785 [Candidatus Saccharimonas sp.]